MQVVPLTAALQPAYTAFLSTTPVCLLHYTLKYRDFLLDLTGATAAYHVAVADGSVVGVLPLLMRDGAFGTVVNSLPFFGSHGGVLAASQAAESVLWRAYQEVVDGAGVAASTVILNPLRPQGDPPIRFDQTDHRIGQFTSLAFGDDESALMAAIDGSTRRNIRKAEHEGVIVTIEHDALPALEAMHRENILAIGGRPKPARFFTAVPAHFAPSTDYDVYVGRINGRIVSALLLFYCGDTAEYFTPGTEADYRVAQPSAAILRRALLDAARHGFKRWNWGGTWTTQQGVLAFKRKWGATEHPYRYFTTVNNPDIYDQTPQRLLSEYPHFYVVPFTALRRSS